MPSLKPEKRKVTKKIHKTDPTTCTAYYPVCMTEPLSRQQDSRVKVQRASDHSRPLIKMSECTCKTRAGQLTCGRRAAMRRLVVREGEVEEEEDEGEEVEEEEAARVSGGERDKVLLSPNGDS